MFPSRQHTSFWTTLGTLRAKEAPSLPSHSEAAPPGTARRRHPYTDNLNGEGRAQHGECGAFFTVSTPLSAYLPRGPLPHCIIGSGASPVCSVAVFLPRKQSLSSTA